MTAETGTRTAAWQAALDAMPWPALLPATPLLGLACVRNESDVIEAFVRHNLALLDALVIIDNASTDDTAGILRLLAEEGLPILVVEDPGLAHSQGARMTAMARLLAARFGGGYLFLLDADEFIVDRTRSLLRTLAESLGAEEVGALPWRTYVPTGDDPDAASPIARIRHRRIQAHPELRKVVLPLAVLERNGLRVAEGNHRMQRPDGEPFPQLDLDTPAMAHFPVRSQAQLVSKVVVGWLSVCLFADRHPDDSWHWKALFDEVIENWSHGLAQGSAQDGGHGPGQVPGQLPGLGPERLQAIATHYSDRGGSELCLDPLGGEGENCRYPDLAAVDPLGRIERFARSAARSLELPWPANPRTPAEWPAALRRLEAAAIRTSGAGQGADTAGSEGLTPSGSE